MLFILIACVPICMYIIINSLVKIAISHLMCCSKDDQRKIFIEYLLTCEGFTLYTYTHSLADMN